MNRFDALEGRTCRQSLPGDNKNESQRGYKMIHAGAEVSNMGQQAAYQAPGDVDERFLVGGIYLCLHPC